MVFTKEPKMKWRFFGQLFDFFNFKKLRIGFIYHYWFFDFLKIIIMNPNNHVNNCQGLFLFPVSTQQMVYMQDVKTHPMNFWRCQWVVSCMVAQFIISNIMLVVLQKLGSSMCWNCTPILNPQPFKRQVKYLLVASYICWIATAF